MKKLLILLAFASFLIVPFITRADLTTDYNTQYYALQQQIINLQNQEQQAMQSQANQPMTSGSMMQAMEMIKAEYQNKIIAIQSQEQQIYLNYQEALNNQQAQQQVCPANASCSNGQFFCSSGYVVSGQSCITYNQFCQNQYGVNSYGDANNCYCNAGYQWNSSKTGCVAIACPDNSSLVGSQCFCNNGYIQSGSVCITYNQDCINNFGQNVHGTKGNNNNSSCDCNAGYQWNSQQTICVVIPATAVSNPAPVVSEKITTTPTPKTIKQENQNQTNPIQNKIPDNKKEATSPSNQSISNPTPSFFTKVFNSIKGFWHNLFK